MKKLLKFNLKNILLSKTFYICLIIMILLSPFSNIFFGLNKYVKAIPQTIDSLSGGVGIISSLFLAIFSCHDYNEGTLKNIVAKGYSRKKIIISKYISAIIALVVMNLITALLIFIVYVRNGIGTYNITMTYVLIDSLFNIIAYTVFYVSLSCIVEKNSSAIIACMFITTIIGAIITFIDSKFNLNISKIWLSNISNSFINDQTITNLGKSILGYTIYTIIFGYIGLNILNKREIK